MSDYNELAVGQQTAGSMVITPVTEEGGRRTYFATSSFACDSTATDIAVFPGVASVTAKILWILVETTATGAATGDLKIIRRTAVDTGQTSANATLGQADNTDAAPSCQPVHFTAHPTALGAAATNPNLFACRLVQPAVSTLTPTPGRIIDFRQYYGGKAVKVAGTSDFLAINVPAALGGAGNAWDISWCWTEQ